MLIKPGERKRAESLPSHAGFWFTINLKHITNNEIIFHEKLFLKCGSYDEDCKAGAGKSTRYVRISHSKNRNMIDIIPYSFANIKYDQYGWKNKKANFKEK